jgi:hypothetical protein
MSSCNVPFFDASNLFFSQIKTYIEPMFCHDLGEESGQLMVFNTLSGSHCPDFYFQNIDDFMDKFLYHDDYETNKHFRGGSQ